MATNAASITPSTIRDLCEAGRYREANELVEVVSKDSAEGLLVHGIVAIQQQNLEAAKNYLTQVAVEDGEFSERAKYHLAVAYWFGGEKREASDLLSQIPDSFLKLLLKAIIEDRPRYSLRFLDAAGRFHVRPGLQGRLHNERGKVLRKMSEPDRAIQEYEAAIYFFEQDGSDCIPLVVNNLAGIYLDYGEFERAHEQADKAIRLLVDDQPHLGQAYDQKARIFLKQREFDEAKRWSEKAVSVLRGADRLEWLTEALTNKARAQVGLKIPYQSTFVEVEKISRYLQRDDLLIDLYVLDREIAKKNFEQSEKRMIEIALRVLGGSERAVAERLAVSHTWIGKMARRYKLKK